MKPIEPRSAVVCVNGWFGYAEYPVTVVGETSKRWICVSEQGWSIRSGTINPGQRQPVPKYAVKFV